MSFAIVTPEEFIQAFRVCVNKAEPKLRELWFDHNKEYTRYFLGSREDPQLLSEVCKELARKEHLREMKCWNEHLRVDMVFYVRGRSDVFTATEYFTDYLTVAIEHEIGFRCSLEEMYKLCLLNVPLSVLITYPDPSKDEVLRKLGEICKGTDIFDSFAKTHRKLLILGEKEKGENQPPLWEFYLYEKSGFIPKEKIITQ